MSLTWLLLILAVVLFALGVLRFDMLVARWRELTGRPVAAVRAAASAVDTAPAQAGLRPHAAPARKPGFHRSGRRH